MSAGIELKDGFVTQNGEWISYKTASYNRELFKINALATELIDFLDQLLIDYDKSSLKIGLTPLNKKLVIMIKSTDTQLPFDAKNV
jgi:hypothetical protein